MDNTVLRKNILLLLLTLLNINLFSQGKVDGFFNGKAKTNIVIGGGAEFANQYFAGKNKVGVARTIYNANLFLSTGLSERLDLNLSAPYVIINDVRSIQDGSAYLKYKAFNKKTSNGNLYFIGVIGFSGNLAFYQTEGLNALGQQAKTIDLRPLVHYSLNNGWFYTGQIGYNYKYDPVPNAINASIKVGKASSNYYVDFWVDHQTSFGGLDYRGNPTPSTFRELGVDFYKIGGTYYSPIAENMGFFVGSSYIIKGRNIGQGIAFNIGFVLKNN